MPRFSNVSCNRRTGLSTPRFKSVEILSQQTYFLPAFYGNRYLTNANIRWATAGRNEIFPRITLDLAFFRHRGRIWFGSASPVETIQAQTEQFNVHYQIYNYYVLQNYAQRVLSVQMFTI